MVISDFNIARLPQTIFGSGSFDRLAPLILERAKTVLLVTGVRSLQRSGHLQKLTASLRKTDTKIYHVTVKGEPSPAFVDEVADQYRSKNIDIVTAIGGGSVLDAGKAISAMLRQNDSVMNYLEGVGHKSYNGEKTAFVAVPTTAGTGSEATKNAVLSQTGPGGFKKSLRHDNLIPDIALVDPELTMTCPVETSAACGMDAFTQLLEPYVSPKASPFTDSLAYSGIAYLKDSLTVVCTDGNNDIQARSAMAYAAYLSGITLANAGLGVVHGFASSIGGLFDIPHGVICATLVAEATKMNIAALFEQEQQGEQALSKYAQIGRLLSGKERKNIKDSCSDLNDILENWTNELRVPKLNHFGVSDKDIEEIVKVTSNKNNPVELDKEQLALLIKQRI